MAIAPPKLLPALAIESLEQHGYGIGRHKGQVCFVAGALPGEVVDVVVTKRRRSHLFGEAARWHHRSVERISPFCQHFGICGGCRWQYLSYPDQLRYKRQFVCNQFFPALGDLLAIGPADIPLPIASPQQRYYRNKLEFSFTASRWLTAAEIATGDSLERRAVGFHKPGRFNRIVAIEHCWLQSAPSNAIRRFLSEWARQHNYSFYDWQSGRGMLRSLIIRITNLRQCMIIMVFGSHRADQRQALLSALRNHFSAIHSLYWILNESANDSIEAHAAHHFAGQKTVIARFHSLALHIHPKSFFQTNSSQLEHFGHLVLEMAALQGDELVYDLYCGIGTLTLLMAGFCQQLWGIEQQPEAVENAIYNASINHIKNAHFICADVAQWLATPHSLLQTPHLIVVDPPRVGLSPAVCEQLVARPAQRILYISCNPATQARDLGYLAQRYLVMRVQPIDMFPHTTHIENVVLLRRRPAEAKRQTSN